MASKETYSAIDRAKHGKLIEFMTDSFKSVEIDGKQVIQTLDGEFVEYILMEEKYFVDNWLIQFAVGHVGEKNYFNHQEWSRLTDGFTKGAIILNENRQPILIIRKFIDMDLNINSKHRMESYARTAAHAANIPNKDEVDGIVSSLAARITELAGQNPDYDTLTAMIPYDYYLSKGIDPTVVKQVIHIRDNYLIDGEPIDPDCEQMREVENILYKHSRNEPVTQKEKDRVIEITCGDFIFDTDPNKVEDKTPELKFTAKDFDPLSD